MTSPTRLSLYYYDYCGYCRRVRAVIDELGIEVELRNIWEERRHLDDLVAARGRQTTPVLRIERGDGDEWMAESAVIIQFLRSSS